MMKNIQWDTKTKIKTALVIFIAFFAGILYECLSWEWISLKSVLIQIAASVAVSLFVVFTVQEKGYSLQSSQSVAMAVSVALLMLMVTSRNNFSSEALLMVFFAPVLLICSQVTVLMPAAALIGVYIVLEHDGVAVMCLPAAVGASLIYLSSKVKESAAWKKILFAVSEVVLIAAAVYAFCLRRYSLTLHSLITQVWDSIGIFVTIAALIALAVVSVIRKRPVGEIFGYIAGAALSAVPMFMYGAYSLPATAATFMIFPVICQDGLPAGELADKALDAIVSKFKK